MIPNNFNFSNTQYNLFNDQTNILHLNQHWDCFSVLILDLSIERRGAVFGADPARNKMYRSAQNT